MILRACCTPLHLPDSLGAETTLSFARYLQGIGFLQPVG
jgi:hypothetical protein